METKTVSREVSEEEVEAEVSVEASEQEDTVAMPPPQELERREEQKLKSKFPGAPGGWQGVKDGGWSDLLMRALIIILAPQ